MATLEDAQRCYKCSQQGTKVKESPGPRGGKVYVFHCQNPVCPVFESGWLVQVKSDGTIPERERGPRQFEPLTNTDKRIAEKFIREVGGNPDGV